MVSQRRRAADRFLALCAALAAGIGATPAAAQSDPFALPKGLTARTVQAEEGPGLSEISVDGDVRKRLVTLSWQGESLTIAADEARAAGLPVAEDAAGMVALDTLGLAKWQFDKFRQRLEIQLMRRSDRQNLIDMHSAGDMRGESTPLMALRLDYDLTATMARGNTSAAGFFDAALVRGNFALGGTMQVNTGGGAAGFFTRLDTQVRVQFPKTGMTATAGDFISAGGQSQRAVRMGGVQIGSDYSLRPDLVTMPLPSFTGQVAVPTGIDLINGDRRYSVGKVEPGEFTVRNVPAQLGRGEIGVVTQDALGREVIQTTRFYVSRNLLARNLSEFAVNAGFVRRRYGLASNDYGPPVASFFYRRGLSSRLTAEATGEWTAGLMNVGARGDLALGGIALATVEARISRNAGTGTKGTLLNFGLESTGSRLSGRIGATFPSAGYRDVAAKLGDALPPRQYVAQINFDLGNNNKVQLTATRQDRRYDPRFPRFERRVDLINFGGRKRISNRIDLFVSAGYRRGEQTAFTAFGGLSLQLGNGMTSQASANWGSNRPFNASTSMQRFDIEGRPLGYSFERNFGAFNRTAGTLSYRTDFGRVEGQLEHSGGGIGARLNARGTLIGAGGQVFARNRTGNTFALVRTGKVNGVAITREDRAAGKTGRGGLLLIDNIPAYVPIHFDVDADKLPADALARDVKKRVIIPAGSVGLVQLDVIRFVPRQVRVVDAAGNPLAPGTPVRSMPSDEAGLVGFDGLVEINAAGGDGELLMGLPGRQCVVEIGRIDLEADLPDELRCLPRAVARADASPAAGKKPLRDMPKARQRRPPPAHVARAAD